MACCRYIVDISIYIRLALSTRACRWCTLQQGIAVKTMHVHFFDSHESLVGHVPPPTVRRHRGGSQPAPRAVFSDIPNPPPELLELRLKLREVLANIGYCMAAGMGSDEQVLRHDLSVKFPDEGTEARLAALAAALEIIAEEAEVAAVLAVSEHVLLPDPPVSS